MAVDLQRLTAFLLPFVNLRAIQGGIFLLFHAVYEPMAQSYSTYNVKIQYCIIQYFITARLTIKEFKFLVEY